VEGHEEKGCRTTLTNHNTYYFAYESLSPFTRQNVGRGSRNVFPLYFRFALCRQSKLASTLANRDDFLLS